MPTFDKIRKKYYSISKDDHPDGLIRHKDIDGNVNYHYGVEGILTSIKLVEDEYEGEKYFKWHFTFEGKEHAGVEILQIGETASAARGILMTLISCPDPVGWVKISPYRNEADGKTYTNVWVEVNGKTVEWREEVKDNLPEVNMVEVGDKLVPDDTARRKYIRTIARRVMDEKIAGTIVHEDGSQATYNGSEEPEQPAPDISTDGTAQAETLYGDGEPEPKKEKEEKESTPESSNKGNKVDMSEWENTDDDLPF